MEEHVHKYVRVKLGKKGFTVFQCILPDCSHYIRSELVIGKRFICWRCDGIFVMNQKTAQYKKPHCSSCVRVPKEVATT